MTPNERQIAEDEFAEDEEGRVGRLLPLGSVAIPSQVRLSDDRSLLLWSWGEPGSYDEDLAGGVVTVDARSPPRDLLDRFVRLRTADQVLSFARAEGVIGLCGHGPLPATHAPAPWGVWEHAGDREEAPALWGCRPSREEPIEVWLAAADFLGRLLGFAAEIHSTRQRVQAANQDLHRRCLWLLWASSRLDACGLLAACALLPPSGYLDQRMESARRLLAEVEPSEKLQVLKPSIDLWRWTVQLVVNQLSTLAGVGAFLQWDEPAPAFRLHAGGAPGALRDNEFPCGLPGALVIQLAAAVARKRADLQCSHCGRSFRPERNRAVGPAYCPREGCQREAQRLASARHRARKAAGLEPLRTRKARKGRKARNP